MAQKPDIQGATMQKKAKTFEVAYNEYGSVTGLVWVLFIKI
jgi:hypothetical protein